MKKKNSPGNCTCCNCLKYVHYFPEYPGQQTINWTDQYTDESGGGWPTYRSKYTAPADHFEINCGAMVDNNFFLQTWAWDTDSTNVLWIRLVDPTTPTTVNLELKCYAVNAGMEYNTSAGGLTSAYRVVHVLVEETTALQADVAIIGRTRTFISSTVLTGMDLDDWKDDRDGEDWAFQNALSPLPVVEVRETHVTVKSAQYGGASRQSEVTSESESFKIFRSGLPMFTGAIPASKVVIEIEQDAADSYDGQLLVVQELKDTIGSANATCPERNCRYIDDYHAQQWDIESSLAITVTGTTVEEWNTTTPDFGEVRHQRFHTGCGEEVIVTGWGILAESRTVSDVFISETLPFAIAGTAKLVASSEISVIADEFSDGTVTAGKVKLRATVRFLYETPVGYVGAPGAWTSFTRNTSVAAEQMLTWSYGPLLTWEWEETRWAGNTRPTFTKSGATATIDWNGATDPGPSSGSDIWILANSSLISRSPFGVYQVDYTTTLVDLLTTSFSI